jgi:hypothetical protein
MTELDLEIQDLRREVAKLNAENRKLKADRDSLDALHQMDMSEIVWLRRLVQSMVEEKEGRTYG